MCSILYDGWDIIFSRTPVGAFGGRPTFFRLVKKLGFPEEARGGDGDGPDGDGRRDDGDGGRAGPPPHDGPPRGGLVMTVAPMRTWKKMLKIKRKV